MGVLGHIWQWIRRLLAGALTLWSCLIVGLFILVMSIFALDPVRNRAGWQVGDTLLPTPVVIAMWCSLFPGWLLILTPRLGQVLGWFRPRPIIGADWIWLPEQDEEPWQSPARWNPPPPQRLTWGLVAITLWSTLSFAPLMLSSGFSGAVSAWPLLLAFVWAIWPRWAVLIRAARMSRMRATA